MSAQMAISVPAKALKMTAAEVKSALRRRHGCDRENDLSGMPGPWVCVEEAFSGSGGGIDLFAIGAWASSKAPGLRSAGQHPWRYATVAYEIKVSRSDYRRELYGYTPGEKARERRRENYWYARSPRTVPEWPAKAERALELSNYFLFAVPRGLLTDEEIERREQPEDGSLWLPPESGLIEVDGRDCHVRVSASPRECRTLNASEASGLIRYAIRNPARAAA